MAQKDRTITVNRKAYHDYSILESVEAGIALTGTEIKSVRAGKVNVRESYIRPEGGELWLVNCHVAQYEPGMRHSHDPYRPRKMLLHRDQIGRLVGMVSQKGLTLLPLKVYIKNGLAKIELGVARGKRQYEKREAIARRESERELRQRVKLKHR
ncbi:MAG: SsrA-binding protein SmpB [Chloroflexota bacterium]